MCVRSLALAMSLWSAEPPDDPGHLFAIVGTKGGRPDIAPRAKLQEEGGSGLVVGGFEDGDDVVGTYRPVDLLAAAVLPGGFGSPIGSLNGLLDGPYPLIGEVDQRNVGGHILIPPFRPA